MKIIIWGYALEGVKLYRELAVRGKYEMIGFADNSPYKKGNIVGEYKIFSLNDLVQLRTVTDFAVIIAASQWFIIGEELEKQHIHIEGVYRNGEIFQYDRMCFERLDLLKNIALYAGDICDDIHMSNSELEHTKFKKIDFLCYHTKEGRLIKRDIDLLKGHIKRLPKDDRTDKPICSMVIDCYK